MPSVGDQDIGHASDLSFGHLSDLAMQLSLQKAVADICPMLAHSSTHFKKAAAAQSMRSPSLDSRNIENSVEVASSIPRLFREDISLPWRNLQKNN